MSNSPAASGELWGHPKGLAYIAFSEAWERFSFYGMQALLMLYMTGHLLNNGVIETVWGFAAFRNLVESVTGPLSQQALAAQIFGIYVALVYFGPVVGGLIGDRWLGRTRAVVLGALLLSFGHFLMAFEAAFLPALGAIICGAGLLKGNLAAQVGALYPAGDRRIDDGYTLYITSVVVGAFVSPLVCGTLGEIYGWHYGFGAAGVGMLIGMVIYLSGLKHIKDPPKANHVDTPKMTGPEWGRVGAICGLILITSLFWTVQSQIWNTNPVWVRDHVDLNIGGGFSIPVTWFQSLDAMAVLLLTPVTMVFWKWLAKRGAEPSDIVKIAAGCALFGIGCGMLTVGQWVAGDAKVSALWPLSSHFVIGLGYLLCSPVALAVVARSAPAQVKSMMVGGYYLGLFVAGIFSGWLGRFYEPLQPPLFWLLHMGIGLAGTLVLLVLYVPLRKILLPKPV